jgi:uncharacterized protein (TIGR02246 family)
MFLSKNVATFCLACLPVAALAQTCGHSDDPTQVVQAQVEALNAHDVEAFAACYAPDVTITDLSGKDKPVHGIPDLKNTYAFLAKMPKDFHVEIVQRSTSGPIVVDHERAIGLPGNKGQPEAFAVYEVREGKIQHVWFPPAK